MASEQTEQLTSKVREKKDELIEKADRKLEPAEGPPSQGEPPFVIGDQTR